MLHIQQSSELFLEPACFRLMKIVKLILFLFVSLSNESSLHPALQGVFLYPCCSAFLSGTQETLSSVGFRFVILILSEKTCCSLTGSSCLWFFEAQTQSNWAWGGCWEVTHVVSLQLSLSLLSSFHCQACLHSVCMELCCTRETLWCYLQPYLWMKELWGVWHLSLSALTSTVLPRVFWDPPSFFHTSRQVALACFSIWPCGLAIH